MLCEITSRMPYPARRNWSASALPSRPGPTIAMVGFFAIAAGYQDERAPRNCVRLAYIVSMPKSSSSKSKARVLSSREVFRGPVFRVTTDQVLEPTGVQARRDIVHHPGSVVILAVSGTRAQPQILLERQYRHAVQDYLWELPAGRIDHGESPLAAAKRELMEETGYSATQWKRILKFYASPGFMDETMAVYMARGLRAGIAQPEADEVIQQRMFPLDTALGMVLKGLIADAKTISGVLWLAHEISQKPRG